MSEGVDKYMPMFPLPVFMFPGEEMPLHIFEPRYKQLIQDCIDGEITFGIPYVRGTSLEQFGTEVKLKSVETTYHDQSMDITVEALKVFKLERFDEVMEEKLYGAGEVVELNLPSLHIKGAVRELGMNFLNRFIGEDTSELEKESLDGYELAARVGFSNDQKIQMLEFDDLQDQKDYLYRELKLLFRIRELEEQSADKFHLN